MKDEIREVIEMMDSLVQPKLGDNYHCILPEHYDELTNDIVKIIDAQPFTMLKDWFTESNDGNNGVILMAECPSCGDAVVYGDGCISCDTIFNFKDDE